VSAVHGNEINSKRYLEQDFAISNQGGISSLASGGGVAGKSKPITGATGSH
jgi:hypothetical protein